MNLPGRSDDRSGARKLAALWGAGRVLYAVGVFVAPDEFARPWLGSALDTGGGRVAANALVARDGLAGLGVVVSALSGAPVRPWLAVCATSDAADLAFTLARSDDLPDSAARLVPAVAGGTGLAGAALFVAVDA